MLQNIVFVLETFSLQSDLYILMCDIPVVRVTN